MNAFDHTIQQYFAGIAFRSTSFDQAVNLVSGIYLVQLVLVAMLWWVWFRNGNTPAAKRDREIVVMTIFASFVALFVGRGLAHWLPFRVRPFANPELGLHFPTDPGVAHVLRTWSSFPSDHAMLWCALAVGIFVASRPLGTIALLYALVMVCIPRIYLGLHYPTDVLGGALLGIVICAALMRESWRAWISRPVLAMAEKHEGLFYVSIFMFSFELTCQFDQIRLLSESLLKHL